jgi:hypothetical protein
MKRQKKVIVREDGYAFSALSQPLCDLQICGTERTSRGDTCAKIFPFHYG